MQIEKKLILCSIIAISIGIATIAPLAYFMSTAKAQTTNNVPWFNVDIPYAYFKATTENETRTFPEGPVDVINYNTNHFIGLDYTVNPQAENILENARVEYFQIQIYSDLGPIDTKTAYFGANCDDDSDPLATFHFSRENWFNTSTSGGGVFITKFNGTLAETLATGDSFGIGDGSGSGCFANTTLPAEFLNAQNAQTIYIDIQRLGYVTFEGNNTIVTLADNTVIQHIELAKSGDKFIYGDLPADKTEPLKVIEPPISIGY